MKYNISKTTTPAMPNLGRGTECITLLLSQVPRDMHQSVVPMLFSPLGAHISGAEFMYPDLSWKETSGMLANFVAESGACKGQLSALVEAICRNFRQHDDEELSKLVEWQKMMRSASSSPIPPKPVSTPRRRNTSWASKTRGGGLRSPLHPTTTNHQPS